MYNVILTLCMLPLWGLRQFTNNPHVAVVAVLLVSITNAWFIVPPSIEIGRNLYLNDVIFGLIFISVISRLLFMEELRNASSLWGLYGFFLFLNLFIGLKSYGSIAGVDFRSLFYYWSGALYFMSFPYNIESLSKIMKKWLSLSLILLAIVYFRIVIEFLGLPMALAWADPTGVPFRVVNSAQTYMLGVVVIFLVHGFIISQKNKPSRFLIVLFVVAVLVLQHRSVWGAILCSFAFMFLLPGIKSYKIFANFSTIVGAGILLLLPLLWFGYADDFFTSIGGSAQRATELHEGTVGYRVNMWVGIIDYWMNQSFLNQSIGDPFGVGYAGYERSPHNFYLQSLLRTGIIGTLIIIVFYGLVLLKLFLSISEQQTQLYYSLFFILVISQLAFYIPYSVQPENGIIIGIAASLAIRRLQLAQTDTNNSTNRESLDLPSRNRT